jgi:competence protein ComEA
VPLPSRKELAVYAVLALVAAVLGVRWIAAQGAVDEPAGRPAAATVEAPREADDVLVHVAGAVREPGVYRVRRGARVRDALRAAGGATGRADVHAINLAARVEDAQQVVVPRRAPAAPAAAEGAGPAAAASGSAAAPSGAAAGPSGLAAPPVSLSTATVEQLDTLHGVGPGLAQRIVEHRTQRGGFSSVDDLAEVPGIGPKRLEALRAAVVP